MTGRLFQDWEAVGVIPGKSVAVGVRDCKAMGVGLGFGVREGAVRGISGTGDDSRLLVIIRVDVGLGIGLVGDGGVTSAAQAVRITQNTKLNIRFIRLSISVKN